MKNLVFLAFLVLILFVVVGWFNNWYSIANEQGSDGRHHVHIELDTQKIKEDTGRYIEKGKQKFQDTFVGPPAPGEDPHPEDLPGREASGPRVNWNDVTIELPPIPPPPGGEVNR